MKNKSAKTPEIQPLNYNSILWAFLFGPLYFAYKQLWLYAFVYFLACILTGGVALLIVPWVTPLILEKNGVK